MPGPMEQTVRSFPLAVGVHARMLLDPPFRVWHPELEAQILKKVGRHDTLDPTRMDGWKLFFSQGSTQQLFARRDVGSDNVQGTRQGSLMQRNMHACFCSILLVHPLHGAISFHHWISFHQGQHGVTRRAKEASKPQSHKWHFAATMDLFKRKHVHTSVT